MDEFPSNSYKIRREEDEPTPDRERKIKKPVTTNARIRKKPLGKKISESFTNEDTQGVGMYILMEVVIPAAKDMISDALSQGVDRMLYGDSAGARSSRASRGRPVHTNYNKVSSGKPVSSSREVSKRARSTHDFKEIVFPTRGEAEQAIDDMNSTLEEYGEISVYDFYDLCGITGEFVDNDWGWTDLRGAAVRRVRDGYMLSLPKTHSIT